MGRKVFKRNWRLPGWLDIPLRGLKYLLLGFFVWAVSGMSAQAIAAFMKSPYGLVADVKMLNFFRFIGHTGLIVLGVLLVASVLLQNFWCRYLCPYGALLGLSSIFSPLHIRRNADRCIDCAKCAKACPAALAVDKLVKIRSAECTGCLECVAVCPAEGALWIGPKDERMPTWAFAVGIALLFFGIVGFARVSGHWKSESHKPCTSSWCRTPMKPVIRCPATRHWRSRLVTFAQPGLGRLSGGVARSVGRFHMSVIGAIPRLAIYQPGKRRHGLTLELALIGRWTVNRRHRSAGESQVNG